MKRHLIFILIFIAVTAADAFGQQTSMRSQQPGGRIGDSTPTDTTASKPRPKPSAWTVSSPLGDHSKSTVDTMLYNIQRRAVASMASDAYATTGTLGAEGINMIFLNRPSYGTFIFDHSLAHSLPSLAKFKFYNVYTPMTLLSYDFGGSKENHLDRLHAIFAGNVNRNIGIGAILDYNYAKGAYTSQAVKDFTFGFSFYFNSHRYDAQALYYHYNCLNKENGGITDDLYITDPAEVQGGVEKVEPKSIPTRLTAAHTRLNGDRLFTTHAFKLGYWTEEQVNDTLVRDVYVPVTKFIYSLDYDGHHHHFINTNTAQGSEFWANTYLNPNGTDDNTRYWLVTNTLGVELLEGFRKWARFGISAYAQLQNRQFTFANYYPVPDLTEEQAAALTPLPEGFSITPRVNHTRLAVGGEISKRQGEAIKYSARAKFGLTGGIKGDVNLDGDVSTRFRLFGDTVAISAYGGFANTSNSFLFSHYISNHFAWSNSFSKTTEIKAGGTLTIPWTRTQVTIGFRDYANYIYFNDKALPAQYAPHIQIFSATLDQKLRFGIWNWNNTVTYQASSEQSVIPLPALAIYSNMFLDFTAFRVLRLNIGVDCDYYTRYYGLAYQPATMSFHTQHEAQVGNFAFCNAYVSAHLYKVRFYVLWSHVNQGWFSKNYFSVPHYPVNPRCLQFGLTIDFAN